MTEHNKSAWASMTTVAGMLVTADNVSRISFYVIKSENKPAELHCRCHALPDMSKQDIENLAAQLNEAIAPVLRDVQSGLQCRAANQLRRFL